MTLIPLISTLAAAPETAPAGAGRYDPGAGHRPLAALLAVGLPLALVVTVALSPMVVDPGPRTQSPPWTSILLPRPEPQPPKSQPQAKATRTSTQATETIDTAFKRPDDPTTQVEAGPLPINPPLLPPGPPTSIDPPAPPKLVPAEVDPRFAGQFQPEYPLREQRAGIEGSVTLRVQIGIDGRVKAVELVRTDQPAFFEAARKRALSKWRFRPATRGGAAEESWKEMTVRFQIRNG